MGLLSSSTLKDQQKHSNGNVETDGSNKNVSS